MENTVCFIPLMTMNVMMPQMLKCIKPFKTAEYNKEIKTAEYSKEINIPHIYPISRKTFTPERRPLKVPIMTLLLASKVYLQPSSSSHRILKLLTLFLVHIYIRLQWFCLTFYLPT